MTELYEYMGEKREELYQSDSRTVTIDDEHFFKLYQAVCYMLQIKNIVNCEENLELMLKRIRENKAVK